MELEFEVNGKPHRLETDGHRALLWVLREDLGITGPKFGCGEGQCGACTVLINGKRAHACRTPVRLVAGKSITTIEGLKKEGRLHPVQEAFLHCDALQCGYCTSGMVLSGVALLQENPHPTRKEIVRFMNANICRCGTYQRIVRAIQYAAEHRTENP